ncbi:unnamed protein product [Staurois parvus]|uniref:Uncharacterized protein n=1 Tax=Staurois parvus TaxID=386267 RepID=A0ABN9BGF3_9NEOB|nr:unnamed protein product [Staurois parvus]
MSCQSVPECVCVFICAFLSLGKWVLHYHTDARSA